MSRVPAPFTSRLAGVVTGPFSFALYYTNIKYTAKTKNCEYQKEATTQNSDISGKLDRMMRMMDVLGKKVAVLEVTNNPGSATASSPACAPTCHIAGRSSTPFRLISSHRDRRNSTQVSGEPPVPFANHPIGHITRPVFQR